MRLIEFDESEYTDEHLITLVSDRAYSLVALFCGLETAEKLRYRGYAYARLGSTRFRIVYPLRSKPDDSGYVFDLFSEAAEGEKEAPQVLALADSG